MTVDERREYRDMMLTQFKKHEAHLRDLRRETEKNRREGAAAELDRIEDLVHEGKSRLEGLETENEEQWRRDKEFLDRKLEETGQAFDRATEHFRER